MSITYYYVRPTDSLFVRGNLAFGDSGEHGTGLMPPPPSLFSGAFRSALLGHDAVQHAAFLGSGQCSDANLAQCLGTPVAPGDFQITWLSLAGEPRSLSDLGNIGCKSTAAVHFSPFTSPIGGTMGLINGKNCPRWGRFSLRCPKSDRLPALVQRLNRFHPYRLIC